MPDNIPVTRCAICGTCSSRLPSALRIARPSAERSMAIRMIAPLLRTTCLPTGWRSAW
jgi:hypothetical protein